MKVYLFLIHFVIKYFISKKVTDYDDMIDNEFRNLKQIRAFNVYELYFNYCVQIA